MIENKIAHIFLIVVVVVVVVRYENTGAVYNIGFLVNHTRMEGMFYNIRCVHSRRGANACFPWLSHSVLSDDANRRIW